MMDSQDEQQDFADIRLAIDFVMARRAGEKVWTVQASDARSLIDGLGVLCGSLLQQLATATDVSPNTVLSHMRDKAVLLGLELELGNDAT